jgi:uncharacterized protein YhaN
VRRVAALARQLVESNARLDLCNSELRKTEWEARELESEIRRLTGKGEVSQADIDTRVAELDRLVKVNDEARSLDEAAGRSEIDLQRMREQAEEVEESIRSLLAEASAEHEQNFLANAEIYRQRQQLLLELQKIPVEAPAEPGMLFDMRPDEEEAFEVAQKELAELEQSLARIDEAAEQWAVLTLCRALLDETRKVYETERQPEVLRQASAFFTVMTEGRYIRVIALPAASEPGDRRTALPFDAYRPRARVCQPCGSSAGGVRRYLRQFRS